EPLVPVSQAIPGVIAAGETWRVVWSWEGNNADGLIAGDDGTLIFANNDASNVMQLDPESQLAEIIHDNANTGGAVSRNEHGALFLASRGLHASIQQLEPERRVLADTFNGEPLECQGGVINDLVAAGNGGVYFTITGAGLYYADPNGDVAKFGTELLGANGVILSPDEQTLYVTNGAVVVAFDVRADGSLTNEREFGRLRGGTAGDGAAVDQRGRVFVSTGTSADVFAPNGEFLGTIPGPPGLHGVAFGGPDKRTLYGIVFYGDWGTPSARNRIYAIPVLTQGYTGRAK
ncbi:MAG TPA: SMP-30/gluconolactonase/LRE family protein, partial [Gammaproteobacteria bacterium]|nr:SMP-30/gluconolactonase/LRE family protein [Gammaproteobacteria bacterium]